MGDVWRIPTRPVLITLLMLVTVAACSQARGPAADEAQPAPPTKPITDHPLDYVALGDSFTAGPLISTVRADPSGCGRSTNNYPAFLADWLEVSSYVDVSCSGAETKHVLRRQRLVDETVVEPQIDAVNEKTDLVTIGLGGNDHGIFMQLLSCAAPYGPVPTACAGRGFVEAATKVERSMVKVLAKIEQRAPHAKIVVIGYPELLPPHDNCLPVDDAVAASLRAVNEQLNASLKAAAEASEVAYVDVAAASAGHDVCAGKRAWVNDAETKLGKGAAFHPFAVGMRGAAAAAYEVVTGEPAGHLAQERVAEPDAAAVIRNPIPR